MLPDGRIKKIGYSMDGSEDVSDDEDEEIDCEDTNTVDQPHLKPWLDPASLANALRNWGAEEVSALEDAKLVWTTRLVCKMFRSFKSAETAWQFFCWVACQPGFTHDIYTISRMITRLARHGCVDLVDQLLSKVEREKEGKLREAASVEERTEEISDALPLALLGHMFTIKKGESFYSVSIGAFANLTNYHVVQDMNPTLDPTNLTVGAEAVFPLFCKCPVHSDLEKGLEYLVTYVWQPWDDILPVSNMFGASAADIVAANNYRNFTDAICRPVLISVKLPIILQSYPSSARSKKSKRGWILIPVLSIMGLLAVFSFCLMVYMRLVDEKRRANLARNCSTLETSDLFHTKKSSKDEIMDHKTIQDKLLPGVSGYIGKPIIYDLKIIMEETMNLSERYRIGGSMYKATINDQIVAVKKTKQASEELTILQKLDHANLVKLMGISSDDHRSFFLVYEYAEMAHWISGCFPDHHPLLLPLAQWYRPVGAKAKQATNSMVLKVDVLVLLGLFSGNKAMEAKDEIEGILEVEDNREEKFRRWMDPKWSFYPVDDALNLAALAKACTSEKSAERPRMTDIVFNLCFLNHLSKCMGGSLGLQVKLRRLFRLLVR
ncbi:hypothetical protein K7X08_033687 [Anisodus acutangulus]|uniref:Protein kinase domain-containing protein n=1 Tax=Anisodus acutangulus TaxID=402998 RepID=A0A9Q1M5P3_9SOLA|nr:hypothetical protein K7X08_033687 [Anisodus acutangulus]